MVASIRAVALLTGLASIHGAVAADSPFKIETRDDILASSRTLAHDLVALYKGNETGGIPGVLTPEFSAKGGGYFWDEAAHFWGTLIDYWRLTGDETYNDLVIKGIQFQRGPNDNFMPPNQTAALGNPDQCVWALSALRAAENSFPSPPSGGVPYLTLAQNVFDNQFSRFRSEVEAGTCGGGLRWQIPMINNGYNYKESFGNGCYFTLAARLARYTGNTTYANVAVGAYDWLTKIGFIDTKTYAIFDGGHVEQNCTDINKLQWSSTASLITLGAANMYNFTNGSAEWKDRLTNLTTATLEFFFPENIAFEPPCESRKGTCTTDMVAFKGYTHRWLAAATQVAPFLSAKILPVLKTSTQAAVKQCTGGESGRACGFYWADGGFVKPNTTGVGEQMNVLAAVSGLLVAEVAGPVTGGTNGGGNGGNGGGNGGDGGNGNGGANTPPKSPSMASRSEVSVFVGMMALLGMYWLL